jgi:hypothetical protein
MPNESIVSTIHFFEDKKEKMKKSAVWMSLMDNTGKSADYNGTFSAVHLFQATRNAHCISADGINTETKNPVFSTYLDHITRDIMLIERVAEVGGVRIHNTAAAAGKFVLPPHCAIKSPLIQPKTYLISKFHSFPLQKLSHRAHEDHGDGGDRHHGQSGGCFVPR